MTSFVQRPRLPNYFSICVVGILLAFHPFPVAISSLSPIPVNRSKGTIPMDQVEANSMTPVAFAVWDGTNVEWNGMKGISTWNSIRFP
jgi:hypothetical protein